MRHVIVAALMLGTAHAALAAQKPNDTQIRVATWSPLQRTLIVGIIGEPSTISFPIDEDIYRVVQTAVPTTDGKSQAPWQGAAPDEIKGTPLGNNLTLWPHEAGTSSMTVITKLPNGQQKVYAFRLIAKPPPTDIDDPDPAATLNLVFKGGTPHSDPPPAAVRLARIERRRQEQQAVAEAALTNDSFLGADRTPCHYKLHGPYPSQIAPKCPIDNGRWTAFRFPGLSQKPAIYDELGGEHLARQHESGDFVVVEEVAPSFLLRLGPYVLEVINTQFNPVGAPTGTGTTAPTVERDLIQARSK